VLPVTPTAADSLYRDRRATGAGASQGEEAGVLPKEIGVRILCVDDDRLVLAITADLIRSMGHEVIEASCGRDAAMAIRDTAAFDLLITDIIMEEGCGGFELAAYARQLRPELKIIYFSGTPQRLPAEDGAQLLAKPCTLGQLRRAIALCTDPAGVARS
jgi:CheY-like chemotaxis protein